EEQRRRADEAPPEAEHGPIGPAAGRDRAGTGGPLVRFPRPGEARPAPCRETGAMTPDDARPTRAATAPGRGGWGRVVAPLRSAATVRAGVYLVVGGVVAGAYVTLVAGFVQMFASLQTPRVAILVLALVSAVLVSTPPLLAPVRTLEIAAVRTFLDVDVPLPVQGAAPPGAATRWRAAAWY